MKRVTGTVYLVGAGPGAPDLITVRAARLLAQADIVFYDALVHPDTVALAADAQTIAVGKRCGRHSTAQRFINKRVIDAAAKFQTVVRLKGGDPMLFGRAQEEIDALECAGIAVEIVPGVTAGLAASAELGISLTRRALSRSVTFATPRVGDGADASGWARSVRNSDTAVLYMAAGQARQVAIELIERGLSRSTPVALVESASLPETVRRTMTLGEMQNAPQWPHHGPVTILIGEVFRRAAAKCALPSPTDGEVKAQLLAS